ncbi:MAG: hypothetical protein IKW88_04325 [Clostridiales bacterium]|nr:hypothetical protein [Clostridiales bacterium]
MDKIRTENNKNNGLTIFIIVNSFLLLLVIFRIFFCIAVLDEAFNVGEAFRALQGNQYLVENWDYFQTGDSFLTPFLFVFYKITGSTDGIILYSRIVFIVLQLLLSVLMYKVLSRFFDRSAAFFSIIIVETAVQFLLFYMWYDNWEVYFRLIGLFLIFYVFSSFGKISNRKAFLLIFMAGVAHACMVYAYPTTIIVYLFVLGVLLFFKRKQSAKVHNFYVLFYLMGAALVFLIFVIYVLKIGYKNLFVFNSVISKVGLASTGRDGYFTLPKILSNTILLITKNIKCYLMGLIVYVIGLLVLYLLRKNPKRALIYLIVMFFGGLVELVYGEAGSLTTGFMMTYLSFYVPPLYLLIRKRSDKREFYKNLIVIVMLSSYVSGLAYGYTALNGSLKFACGARPCAIIAILLAYEVLKQYGSEQLYRIAFSAAATVLVVVNVLNMYGYSFEGTAPFKCNTRINSGIYKGLLDTSETAERYKTVYHDLGELVRETDKTITCGPYAMEFYLITNLKPNTSNLWDPNNTELLLEYYDTYYGKPDLIVLHDSVSEYTNKVFLDFVKDNYQLAKYTDGYYIYRKKL